MIDLRTEFVPSFFVLGHICYVLISIPGVLKQNIAEMTWDASSDKKTIDNKPFLKVEYSVLGDPKYQQCFEHPSSLYIFLDAAM